MNPVEARHVQHLLGWVTRRQVQERDGEVVAAACELAAAARAELGVGPTAQEISAIWGRTARETDEPVQRSAGVRVVGPLYQRIAAELAEAIEAGVYPPGERLPSESELMARYRVSRMTVRAATGVLRDAGLVVTAHGRGTHVRGSRAEAPQARADAAEARAER